MKNFFIFLLVFILLIGIVNSQEEPKYNFGTMQADSELSIAPGETAVTTLYFYNIHGNRITHIVLSIGESSENWDISFDPSLHKTKVKVAGVLTTVEENLYVRPSESADEIPSTIPEGIEYISSPVGYIGAKPVIVKITVPEDEEIGKIGEVRIDALASWLGQGGMVTLTQGRSFDYTINVVSEEFTEQILEKPKVESAAEKEVLEAVELEKAKVEEEPKVEGEVKEGISTKEVEGISPNVFYGTVTILGIIIIILLTVSFRKKKEKK